MDVTDLDQLSLEELKALRDSVEQAIERRLHLERAEALQEIKEIAQRVGLDLLDLREAAKESKVRYRHPKDPSKTWAGRGRKPIWLEEELAAGKTLESFAV